MKNERAKERKREKQSREIEGAVREDRLIDS